MARAEGVRRVEIMKVGAVKAAAAATTCESTARRNGTQRTLGWPILLSAKKAQFTRTNFPKGRIANTVFNECIVSKWAATHLLRPLPSCQNITSPVCLFLLLCVYCSLREHRLTPNKIPQLPPPHARTQGRQARLPKKLPEIRKLEHGRFEQTGAGAGRLTALLAR